MKLTRYYKLYHFIERHRLKYRALQVARLLGLRYLVVRMDTNFLCNLKCPSCHFSADRVSSMRQPAMSLELFQKIGRDIFPRTRILILSCGAEPLMTRNFDQFLDASGAYNLPFLGFVTNGMLLNEKHVEASVRNRVSEIIFSLDGATKETYEKHKAGGNFEQVLGNIEMLRSYRARVKAQHPAIRFNYVLTRSNITEVCDFLKLAKSLGGSTVRFRHLTDWGAAMDFSKETLSASPELYNRYHDEAKQSATELGIEALLPAPFDLSSHEGEKQVSGNDKKSAGHICIQPWAFLYVEPQGLCRPCFFVPPQGDLSKMTFSEYQSLPEMKERKQRLLHDVENSCLLKDCRMKITSSVNDDSNFLLSDAD